MNRGERLIKFRDSWFFAKTILVDLFKFKYVGKVTFGLWVLEQGIPISKNLWMIYFCMLDMSDNKW